MSKGMNELCVQEGRKERREGGREGGKEEGRKEGRLCKDTATSNYRGESNA